jgi:hypothetical protein
MILDTNKEAGLEVNMEKTYAYVHVHCQDARQYHNIKTNKFFKKVETFKYLGMTVIHQNYSYSCRNNERIKFGINLLPFISESFSSHPLTKK